MIRLLSGDARDVLPTLPAESVQCVVTSPPYYGLRDYGTALWDGGDAACDHKQSNYDRGERATRGNIMERTTPYRDTCGKCGAVRVDRQIGLESDPETYLATMVGVFREVRRVLRRDGTCWVNMGDSYAGSPAGNFGTNRPEAGVFNTYRSNTALNTVGWRPGNPDKNGGASNRDGVGNVPGLAAKQLLLMPARLALALQADGWWVRSAIVWAKPNPMPESVSDRPTSAYEMVYLLSRSAKYYYDADAVREEADAAHAPRYNIPFNVGPKELSGAGRPDANGYTPGMRQFTGTRNLRNVWTLATHAYPDAHFATFPPELAERCIKAGTSERGCCAACGKPWGRVTERINETRTRLSGIGVDCDAGTAGRAGEPETTTTGWAPGCQCNAETRPCVVLDPFIGAGTTALVADRQQRDCIGIDLNVSYTEMAMERCRADAPLFTSFPPAEDPEETRMADLFTDMAAD